MSKGQHLPGILPLILSNRIFFDSKVFYNLKTQCGSLCGFCAFQIWIGRFKILNFKLNCFKFHLNLINTNLNIREFPGSSVGKESACNAGDLGSITGLGRSLEKEMATHSSILAWKIPWTEKPGGLQSMGSKAQI